METKGEKPLIIECGDGRIRAIRFQPGTTLIAHSVVIDSRELTESQRKGLGLPPDYEGPVGTAGDFLDEEPPFGDPL